MQPNGMSKLNEVRENEVAFCADVKSWADALFASRPDWPFTHAKIEQYGLPRLVGSDYVAGKWGRFLRAPDLYFRLIKDYRSRLVRLGEIAEVKRGITSGCDAFFMPHDVTEEVLDEVKEGLLWTNVGLMTSCKRSEIESGEVRIVRAGDNTLHPIETKYLKPEVHSLMQVDRPVIRASDLDRVVR